MSDAPEMSTDGTDAIEDSAVIEAVVADLAKLSIIEYEKVRKDKAKELGFRATVLDVLVKAARPRNDTQPASGNVMSFAEPEAWPHPVDGAALVADIEQVIGRYVFLPNGARLACSLWVLFTHVFEAARVSPRLLISSPTRRCGKTRLLEVIAELACRVEAVSSISPAAVFRAVEAWQPTLLIDEFDAAMADNEELRGIVNSGHRPRFAYVIRIEEVGGERVPVRFSTWCPMAVAGIDKPGDTIVDRSVIIDMQRRPPHEKVDKLTPHGIREMLDVKRRAIRWAADNLARIGAERAIVPDLDNDRAEENWTVLLAIAQVAGDEIAARARIAARELIEGEFEDEPARITLLRDLLAIFDDIAARTRDNDRISTKEILPLLNEDDRFKEHPWPGWSRGKGLSPNSLARLLKPFKIASSATRFADGNNIKGYQRKQFEAAWEGYLRPEKEPPGPNPGFQPSQRHTPHETAKNDESQPSQQAQQEGDVTAGNAEKPQFPNGCDVVTAENPESPDEHVFDL